MFEDANWGTRVAWECDASDTVSARSEEAWEKFRFWIKWVCLLGAASHEFSPPRVVSRGLTGLPDSIINDFKSKVPGDKIFWAALSSTTEDATISWSYCSQKEPVESNAIFTISDVYEGLEMHQLSQYPKERELLLPPFSLLEVTEVTWGIGVPVELKCDFKGCQMSEDLQEKVLEDLDKSNAELQEAVELEQKEAAERKKIEEELLSAIQSDLDVAVAGASQEQLKLKMAERRARELQAELAKAQAILGGGSAEAVANAGEAFTDPSLVCVYGRDFDDNTDNMHQKLISAGIHFEKRYMDADERFMAALRACGGPVSPDSIEPPIVTRGLEAWWIDPSEQDNGFWKFSFEATVTLELRRIMGLCDVPAPALPVTQKVDMDAEIRERFKSMRQAFLSVDYDRSGFVTRKDLLAKCEEWLIPVEEAERILDEADIDQDSCLDFNEFALRFNENPQYDMRQANMPPRSEKVFDKVKSMHQALIDSGNYEDGFISKEDLLAACEEWDIPPDEVDRVLDEIAMGDERIALKEFVACFSGRNEEETKRRSPRGLRHRKRNSKQPSTNPQLNRRGSRKNSKTDAKTVRYPNGAPGESPRQRTKDLVHMLASKTTKLVQDKRKDKMTDALSAFASPDD